MLESPPPTSMSFHVDKNLLYDVRDLWLSEYGGFTSDPSVNNGVTGLLDGKSAFVSDGHYRAQERRVNITFDNDIDRSYSWIFSIFCNETRCMSVAVLQLTLYTATSYTRTFQGGTEDTRTIVLCPAGACQPSRIILSCFYKGCFL
jgi:hypothetical protein